jgi:chemotaxis receptor (MCP) glutamine deamidase CheD
LELQARHRGLSAEGTAEILHALDAANYQCDQVEAVVKEMLDAGSRYKNLEKALGEGVLFVLGQEISET